VLPARYLQFEPAVPEIVLSATFFWPILIGRLATKSFRYNIFHQ